MKSKILLLILFCFFKANLWCQNSEDNTWKTLRHQFHANYGLCDDVRFIQNTRQSIEALGLSYSFSFSKHLYSEIHWQKTSLPFTMYQILYPNNVEFKNIPSPSNPIELPYIPSLTTDRIVEEKEIRAASVVKLTSSEGYYRMNQYHLDFGYQKTYKKHRFRAALGLSYFRWVYRDINANVKLANKPLRSDIYLYHLVVKDIKAFGYNGKLSYDYALTRSLSVGFNMLYMFDDKLEERTTTMNLSIGFTPHIGLFSKKK
jgi:hypothetical protein